MAFKEAMRLTPPVPSLPRRAVRDFEFMGYRIPAGAGDRTSTRSIPITCRRFGPTRSATIRCASMPEASRARHKFAFVPFGGGAHMCLGLNFAYMQAKCFTWHFLNRFPSRNRPGYRPAWNMWPIPYPRDGLHVTLAPV